MAIVLEKQKCGFIYVATGARFLGEAKRSIESLRAQMPEIPVCVFSDRETNIFDLLSVEVRVLSHPIFGMGDKIKPLKDAPYECCVFIDTDTQILEDLSDVFGVLDYFDLGICHDVIRRSPPLINYFDWFGELNTGFFVFRRCDATRKLFDRWLEIFEEFGIGNDQSAFRKALFEEKLNFVALPNEYNLRPVHGWLAGGNARVKMLHGRGMPFRKALRKVNQLTAAHRGDNLKPRLGKLSLIERLIWSLRRRLGLDEV